VGCIYALLCPDRKSRPDRNFQIPWRDLGIRRGNRMHQSRCFGVFGSLAAGKDNTRKNWLPVWPNGAGGYQNRVWGGWQRDILQIKLNQGLILEMSSHFKWQTTNICPHEAPSSSSLNPPAIPPDQRISSSGGVRDY